jgi:hypothetical protein
MSGREEFHRIVEKIRVITNGICVMIATTPIAGIR